MTQVVYDVNAAKNLVSDYHYECAAREGAPAPIVFTFSGVRVDADARLSALAGRRRAAVDRERPQARHRHLEASYRLAIATATELMAYCRTLGVPFGINVESVSIRRVEIEASVRLAQQLRTLIRR